MFLRNTGSPLPQVTPNEPVQTVPSTPKRVKAEPAVKVVAGKFILTAVQRKNLDQAWTIVGPGIRQDLTYKEWLTGDIPVVPFLKKIKLAPLKVGHLAEELRAPRGRPHPGQGQGSRSTTSS